jgi:shikimate dehydrogenase
MTGYRFAVLGDPIEHSRSPDLHHAMLQLAGLSGEYLRIRADHIVLAETVEGLRSGEWDGLNVTMPLKEEAARLADELAPMAARAGSVNTLVRKGQTVVGHSTDCVAFRQIAADTFAQSSVFHVLGAGGSAAAALAALSDDVTVYVSARRPEQADVIAGRHGAVTVAWGTAVVGAVVINATSLGMKGETVPEAVLETASGLIDLPYGDRPTPAIREASSRGIEVVDGHEFLMRQAIESFHLWTGVSVGLSDLMGARRKT